MVGDELIKKADMEKIVREGQKIYEKIKDQYEPNENGKYLAIEVESGKVYFGQNGIEVTELAKKEYPDRVFFLMKIGYTTAEMMLRSFIQRADDKR